jgi:tetratricopeptide (TPR) repeat protein
MAAFAALVLRSFAADSFAAENVAPTKAELEEMYNAAFRAFDSNKFAEALKQLDAIDARQPDLAASKNLRGVILMRQGNYDQAEAALQDAARIDPKFWNARFNLAEIPFLKKDWAEARNRFEQLLSSGESDLAKEASQLIQYKILLTYLLEGKDNMVDSIQAKLELSPDTPAVDYVKAAVALQQKNQKEAKDWISVAEKNFSPQLNKLFAESLYEVGWLEKPAGEARPSLPLMTAAERSEKAKATCPRKVRAGTAGAEAARFRRQLLN